LHPARSPAGATSTPGAPDETGVVLSATLRPVFVATRDGLVRRGTALARDPYLRVIELDERGIAAPDRGTSPHRG
jgi:hypothetical protein